MSAWNVDLYGKMPYAAPLHPKETGLQRAVILESRKQLFDNVVAAMLAADPDVTSLVHYSRQTAIEIEVTLLAAKGAQAGHCDYRLARGISDVLDQQIVLYSQKECEWGEIERDTYKRALIAQRVCIGLLRGGVERPRTLQDPESLQTFFFRSLRQLPSLRAMCVLKSDKAARQPRCAERLSNHCACPRERFESLLRAIDTLEPDSYKIMPQHYLTLLRHAYFFQEQPQTAQI